MPNCEKIDVCPFFSDKMPDDRGVGAMFKKKYCQGDNSDCARYLVMTALGPGTVPITLYPNMVDDAQEIIKQGKS